MSDATDTFIKVALCSCGSVIAIDDGGELWTHTYTQLGYKIAAIPKSEAVSRFIDYTVKGCRHLHAKEIER